jgi:hypothetical protein
MTPLSEEEIQRLLEKGEPISSSFSSDKEKADAEVYSLLFEELGKIKPVTAPAGFSNRVTARLRARQYAAQDWKFYFLIAAVVFLCAFIVFGYLSLSHSVFVNQLKQLLFEYKWLVIFGTCCLLVIQYLDHKLISKKIDQLLVEAESKNRSAANV